MSSVSSQPSDRHCHPVVNMQKSRQAVPAFHIFDEHNMFAARPNFLWLPTLVGHSFAEVPAGYLLWCRCMAELLVLNDEYTCQWQ